MPAEKEPIPLSTSEQHILAADIGGTNSRFAHFTLTSDGELHLAHKVWLTTADYRSLDGLFLGLEQQKFPLSLQRADVVVLGVAGPVEGGNFSSPPYISWDINLRNADQDFGIKRYLLINDFVAQAFACRSHAGQMAEPVLAGEMDPCGTVGVIGAGTNLGKAMLIPVQDRHSGKTRYLAVPSEGGHVTFPAQSQRELEFAHFAAKRINNVYLTCNNVVSGKGISFVHEFLTGKKLEPKEVTALWEQEIAAGRDPESLQWSSRFYGRVCRNFVLDALALGGVFIAGGVAAKTPMLLKHRAFSEEFRSSPSHQELLSKVPVKLITDEDSGLWGAAFAGMQELIKHNG